MPIRVVPILILAAVLLAAGLACKRAAPTSEAPLPATVEEKRAERERPSLRVAPAALPRSAPLVGSEGKDAAGYPKQHVDRAGLRAVLHARKYAELTKHVEVLQESFEKDPRKEYWAVDAGEAFGTPEADLDVELDSWVAAAPKSFAPYLARGAHRVAVMWSRRGLSTANETAKDDFRAMHEAALRADADLVRAIALRPRCIAAMRNRIRVALATSDHDTLVATKELALKTCPDCMVINVVYLKRLTPRWGGSEAVMEAYARNLPSTNPRLRALLGYAAFDRADLLFLDEKHAEALAVVDRAVAAGDYWEYRRLRARVLMNLGRFADAIGDLDLAIQQRGFDPELLSMRAEAYKESGNLVAAGRDLLIALRLDPADATAKYFHASVADKLVVLAQEKRKKGERDASLESIELARDLAQLDPEIEKAYAAIVIGDATTAELETAVKAAPGDFAKVHRLEYALRRDGQWEKLVTAWGAYLAAHPDDARALARRSKALAELGRAEEARADARRACDLGIAETRI
jgi:tetratricopeptide (TPR) repeat protein